MKVIENYKTALENSDESLFKEVFAPQVRIEIPAGASLDQASGHGSLYHESGGQNRSWHKMHPNG